MPTIREPRIELYQGGVLRKQWYFRFVAANGEIVAQSEGYSDKRDALDTVELVRQDFDAAQVIEK